MEPTPPRKTVDGYLVGYALAARTGVQTYSGDEVGRPDLEAVRVWRPDEEVFAVKAMASFAGKPITIGHPDEIVTADNWKDYAVGMMGEEVEEAEDRRSLRVSFALMDGNAIRRVEAANTQGTPLELSVGYRSRLDWTSGQTPEGEQYDAVQRDIFVDHLALVKAGRANEGEPQRPYNIGGTADALRDAFPISFETIKEPSMSEEFQAVAFGDSIISVRSTDAVAAEKIKADMAAMKKKYDADMAAKQKELDDATKARDEAIGEAKATKQKLADATSPTALSALVKARTELIDAAKAIGLSGNLASLSDEDVRRKAVALKLGDEAVKDASAAEIGGMFKACSASATTDSASSKRTIKTNDASSDAVFTDAAWNGIKRRKEA